MNIIRKQLLVAIFIVFGCCLFAQQNLKLNRGDFKNDKEVWESIKKAEDYFDKGKVMHERALKHYLFAYDKDSLHALLNYKIGICFLHSDAKLLAKKHLLIAFEYGTNLSNEIYYYLGKASQYRLEFNDAINYFIDYKKSVMDEKKNESSERIDKLITECRHGKKLVQNEKKRLFVENPGVEINSVYDDFCPVIKTDDFSLLFTSKRKKTALENRNPQSLQYDEGIFMSKRIDKCWNEATLVTGPFNSSKRNSVVGITHDGQELFIATGKSDDIIYSSASQGNNWSRLTPFKKNLNVALFESSISISPDGNKVYFIANKGDNIKGGKDIFVITKNKKNQKWGKPEILKGKLNTKYDENGVFIHHDNKTLFFSSKGHNSMGGSDIFKSIWSDENGWSDPENLGYPINTPADELYFSMTADEKYAYFSSNRVGGIGKSDIYQIFYLGPKKDMFLSNQDDFIISLFNPKSNELVISGPKEKNVNVIIVNGTVKDNRTLDPISSKIEIADYKTKELLTTIRSDSATGEFIVPLPKGQTYEFYITAVNYIFHSEKIETFDSIISNNEDFFLNVKLQPVQKGSKIILKNVTFPSGQYYPKKSSNIELNEFYNMLKSNPALKIRVLGHTDNKGDLSANTELSKKRADNIKQYFTDKGISSYRIESLGCSYLKPIATNNTKEGRKRNRRIEILIIED